MTIKLFSRQKIHKILLVFIFGQKPLGQIYSHWSSCLKKRKMSFLIFHKFTELGHTGSWKHFSCSFSTYIGHIFNQGKHGEIINVTDPLSLLLSCFPPSLAPWGYDINADNSIFATLPMEPSQISTYHHVFKYQAFI